MRWPGVGEWRQRHQINDDEGSATQEAPNITASGVGQAIAVWIDHRHASPEVYAAELHLTVYELRLPLLLQQQ